MADTFPCTGKRISPYPLVLLHGWGFDSRIWAEVIPALQLSFDVVAIDLPCFGNSEYCSSNMDAVAQNLIGQLPEKGILLGWSLGGLVATHLAIHFSPRVAALITVGSNLKWLALETADENWPGAAPGNFAAFFENLAQNFESTRQHFCGVIARGDCKEKSLTRQLSKKLSSAPQENFLKGLQLLADIDNRAGFSNLQVPGLHVFGEKDAMVPLAVEQQIRLLNQNQRTEIIPGTAHAPFLSEPEIFASVVRNFIQSPQQQTNKSTLDKKRISGSFSKAAVTYDSAAQLQRDIGDQLFLSLPESRPLVVLDLGSGTGYYSQRLQECYPFAQVISLDIAQGMVQVARSSGRAMIGVCGDAELLPFKNHSIDVIFSNLAIQWCQDYQQLFAELYRVLAPGGQCVISTFQEGTLGELKAAWKAADDLTHVNYFPNAGYVRESASQAGFCSVAAQQLRLVQYYETVKELSMDLKAIGAHNINSGRPDGLTGKRKLKKMLAAYESFRCDDKLPASYEIIFLFLKKE